jgi:alcohol dehydrogenase class IV
MAFEDPSTGGNPKKINQKDLKEMYEKSISGNLF